MPLSRETVEYVANLSRIELAKEELEKISKQLEAIIGFIDALRSADVTDVEPTDHIVPLNNWLRSDEPRVSLPIEKTLANAPHRDGRFFAVPKIIE